MDSFLCLADSQIAVGQCWLGTEVEKSVQVSCVSGSHLFEQLLLSPRECVNKKLESVTET